MAAPVNAYVNPDSVGGDGTTPLLTGSTAAYKSLSIWEAARNGDLTAAGTPHIVHCANAGTGTSDTTNVIITGWVTDAINRITIIVDQTDRHAGIFDLNKYNLITVGNALTLSNGSLDITIEGLQVSFSGSGNLKGIGNSSSAGTGQDWIISDCIVRGTNTAARWGIIAFNSVTGNTAKIFNNIVYDITNASAEAIRTGSFTAYIYNNTVVNNTTGIRNSSGTVTLKNNICNGNTPDYNGIWTGSLTNISQDSTSPNAALQLKTVTFVDSAGGDFHLASGDIEARNNGTDLSADANLAFTTDIDNDTRSGTWDIGADEFISVSGGISIPVVRHYRERMGMV